MQKFFLVACLFVICSLDIGASFDNVVKDHARVHTFTNDRHLVENDIPITSKRSTRQRRAADATCQRQKENFLKEVKTKDIVTKVI